MNRIFSIAGEEWRLWMRSRLALGAAAVFAALLAATAVLTAARMDDARERRASQQAMAEEAFLSQPARHPHRMVHYGHYVFRAPPPLSMIDPGVDAVTGQSIFLEGHRQNTAMFADARAGADIAGFSELTPAGIYQFLAPLLLIAVGHGLIAREREGGTLAPLLAQGVTGMQIYLGKGFALACFALAGAAPLFVMAALAGARGEAWTAGAGIAGLYAAYLLVWCGLIMLVSVAVKSRGIALGLLVLVWLAAALAVPRIAVESSGAVHPSEGKIRTDLRMQADIRAVGDGHNDLDPAFTQLRANILAQYEVERVEDLPVNFRGVVAESSEADLTGLMNRYADEQAALEAGQARHARSFGWISPVLAVAAGSRALSGTDLATHHRFLREAEAVRYDFVQGLNQIHARRVAYDDDINRSSDPDAERRTRVSAENWRVLSEFEFQPDAAGPRIARAGQPALMLLLWLALSAAAGMPLARRVEP